MQTQITRDGRILLRNRHGAVCAGILPDGTLYREVRRSKHLLRKPPAWAFEREVLQQAEAHGAHLIRVVDLETGQRYIAPLTKFWTQGISVSRGWGEQIALPLSYWHEEQPAQGRLF